MNKKQQDKLNEAYELIDEFNSLTEEEYLDADLSYFSDVADAMVLIIEEKFNEIINNGENISIECMHRICSLVTSDDSGINMYDCICGKESGWSYRVADNCYVNVIFEFIDNTFYERYINDEDDKIDWEAFYNQDIKILTVENI